MKTEKEAIDVVRFATIYEVITSVFKDNLTIEEMEKMIARITRYVAEEKRSMQRG